MRINYNVSANIANNKLNFNDNKLAESIQRLSSGLKINSAADDAAGLSIAKKMNAQIKGLQQASSNSNNGISALNTADGAMTEIHDILQRMNELAVKSANGTNASTDRKYIQEEINQLVEEVDRIADTAQFNAQNLLDGTFALKGYTNSENVKAFSYSDYVDTGKYSIGVIKYKLTSITTTDEDGNTKTKDTYSVTNLEEINKYISDPAKNSGFPRGCKVTAEDDIITISGDNYFEIKLEVNNRQTVEKVTAGTAIDHSTTTADMVNTTKTEKVTALANGEKKEISYEITGTVIDITNMGGMRLQVGANEGQVVEVVIPSLNTKYMGIDDLDVSTEESATKAIDYVGKAIQYVSSIRSKVGAYENRIEHTIKNTDTAEENMTSAYSRIMDVDMSKEMTTYSTYQILVESSTSMLSHANEAPQSVLRLLQ